MRNKPCLTADDAHKMMAACKAEAQKNKWAVAIAIVDDSGAALLLERLDGCGAISSRCGDGQGADLRAHQAAEQVLRGPRQGAPGASSRSRRRA